MGALGRAVFGAPGAHGALWSGIWSGRLGGSGAAVARLGAESAMMNGADVFEDFLRVRR